MDTFRHRFLRILAAVSPWSTATRNEAHVQAAPDRAQESHFDHALELAQSGQYASAVGRFEQANRLSGDKSLLCNLGVELHA